MSLCEYKYRNMSYGGITGAPATGVQPLKNKVYIYNSNGVQTVIPMKHFVNPKK